MEMVKVQEESFIKMQNEISSLQNKIKGLEQKLGPSSSKKARQYAETF